jgi:hypothetical protein
MEKIDFKKKFKDLYNPPSKEVLEVVVPAMNYLMVDGKGDPNKSAEFQEAIQALYPLAYAIKFYFKKNKNVDYGVMPLEGLWWSENMDDFVTGNRDNWQWTLMIMQPDFVTKEIFEENLAQVKKKKDIPALPKIRFGEYHEGQSAQIMHIGSFSAEGPNIARLHEFIKSQDSAPSSKHHEIYLSDFRRVNPKKMKTVLRQPYK